MARRGGGEMARSGDGGEALARAGAPARVNSNIINNINSDNNCRQTSRQTGYYNIPCRQTTRARAHARDGAGGGEGGRLRISDPAAYFKAFREKKWGGDFDPVALAVDEAVVAFSSGKSEPSQTQDRRIWLKIANRVGYENFLDATDQMLSEMRESEVQGRRYLSPAAAFQKLLNKRFPR